MRWRNLAKFAEFRSLRNRLNADLRRKNGSSRIKFLTPSVSNTVICSGRDLVLFRANQKHPL